MLPPEGKRVLVTGAAGPGIGQACARLFAEQVAEVWVSDRAAPHPEEPKNHDADPIFGRDTMLSPCCNRRVRHDESRAAGHGSRGLDAGVARACLAWWTGAMMRVLVVKDDALLRRADPALPPVLVAGDLAFDSSQREARRGGRRLDLTPKELAVLELLLTARGRVVSAEELLITPPQSGPLSLHRERCP